MRIWVQFQHLCFKFFPMAYCELVLLHFFINIWIACAITIFKLLSLGSVWDSVFALSHLWEWTWELEHFLISHFIWCPKFDHELKIRVVTIFQLSKKGAIWTKGWFPIYIDPKIWDTFKFLSLKLGIHLGILRTFFLHSHKVLF